MQCIQLLINSTAIYGKLYRIIPPVRPARTRPCHAPCSESQVSHRHRRHDASHAGAQIRILPQHLARQDKAARAGE